MVESIKRVVERIEPVVERIGQVVERIELVTCSGPEARRGWGPVPVTEWTESRNWTESTETREAKRSALPRGAGAAPPQGEVHIRAPPALPAPL